MFNLNPLRSLLWALGSHLSSTDPPINSNLSSTSSANPSHSLPCRAALFRRRAPRPRRRSLRVPRADIWLWFTRRSRRRAALGGLRGESRLTAAPPRPNPPALLGQVIRGRARQREATQSCSALASSRVCACLPFEQSHRDGGKQGWAVWFENMLDN